MVTLSGLVGLWAHALDCSVPLAAVSAPAGGSQSVQCEKRYGSHLEDRKNTALTVPAARNASRIGQGRKGGTLHQHRPPAKRVAQMCLFTVASGGRHRERKKKIKQRHLELSPLAPAARAKTSDDTRVSRTTTRAPVEQQTPRRSKFRQVETCFCRGRPLAPQLGQRTERTAFDRSTILGRRRRRGSKENTTESHVRD